MRSERARDLSQDVWERSETLIKMERTSFAHGAMRECFRMKKMSQASPEGEGRGEGLGEAEMSEGRWLYAQVNAHFFYAMDWKDCNNYVAKRCIHTPCSVFRPLVTSQTASPRSYISPDTSSDTYLNDIKMQMVAKHYAELYNALKPPKGVDFLHAFAIEVRLPFHLPAPALHVRLLLYIKSHPPMHPLVCTSPPCTLTTVHSLPHANHHVHPLVCIIPQVDAQPCANRADAQSFRCTTLPCRLTKRWPILQVERKGEVSYFCVERAMEEGGWAACSARRLLGPPFLSITSNSDNPSSLHNPATSPHLPLALP